MHKNVLISGGCGFIGHHMVEFFLKETDCDLYIVDKLTYASYGLDRLREIGALENPRVHLYIYDLTSEIDQGFLQELKDIQYIIHLAAETHVDNSISDPKHCIMNNVLSTTNLLEFARKLEKIEKFLYFSTDEVYGPALDGKLFKEYERHNPTNPYSASKSASEMICKSYANTYKIPLIICNTMNVYGERQHNEKFIPKCIHNILNDKIINIHSYPYHDGDEIIAGSRFYIYAKDVALAVYFILQKGIVGETYNIAGQDEIRNDELCDKIADILHKTVKKSYIQHDDKRPGHDLRYGLDGSKLFKLDWKPECSANTYLRKIVEWTVQNKKWM
jgi:dTDP-glucose 4,6-dehydratase